MTAVEWLIQQLRNGKELNDNLIQQAKEMEKEFVKGILLGVIVSAIIQSILTFVILINL